MLSKLRESVELMKLIKLRRGKDWIGRKFTSFRVMRLTEIFEIRREMTRGRSTSKESGSRSTGSGWC